MYPQPPYSFAIGPTVYSHQPYSSNPLLLSFPQPDQVLHPPGADPPGNSGSYLYPAGYGCQTINSQDSNAGSNNCIVKQADPIRYAAAVQFSDETSVVSTSLHSACNDNWTYQLLVNDTKVQLPNQTKIMKPMRCEICDIDCNSRDVFEKHISGKKHKRNLQIQTNPTNTILSGSTQASVQSQMNSIQGQALFGAAGQELESKKQKLLSGGAAVDSVRICTICNIACNSQEVFSKHLSGKKHAAQVGLMSNKGIGPYLAAFKRQGIGPWKKSPKKIKVAQAAWCEVCKINCNSKDVYITHLSGKKHLKNLEKLSKSKNDSGSSTNVVAVTTNPIIGPREKPDTDEQGGINSHKSQKTAVLEAPEKDVEMKKHKLLEAGAAVAAVRLCTLCNVACNSQTVFDSHLAGHKHAAMVKKQAESIGATTG